MIGKYAILVAILQSVMSSSSKDSYVYDLEKPITDVRGGVALKVTYPTEVQNAIGNKGSMDVILGNFGHIQYGTSIQGELIYPADNPYGCDKYTQFFKGTHFVLVKAGACSITTKVRNVEKSGGMAAVIGDGFYE